MSSDKWRTIDDMVELARQDESWRAMMKLWLDIDSDFELNLIGHNVWWWKLAMCLEIHLNQYKRKTIQVRPRRKGVTEGRMIYDEYRLKPTKTN